MEGAVSEHRFVPWLEGSLTPLSELLPGTSPGVLPARVGRVGALICFEALDPELSADSVRAGAELLAVMSNDAWFGDTRTHGLLAAMLTFRAVEMRRDLVRAANRGASGVVDATGASRLRVDLGPERAAVHSVSLRRGFSPYARFGDLWRLLCRIDPQENLADHGDCDSWCDHSRPTAKSR